MTAAVVERYGGPDVVQIKQIPKPVVKDNEILVAIRATTVSRGDARVRGLNVPYGFGVMAPLALGFGGPRTSVLGTEFAGTVEAVGGKVQRFKVGDAVFGFPGSAMGCHAQYRTIAEDGPVALKPANVTFEQAAALSFGGSTALDFLQRAKLKEGERILINGASGCVGIAAVQIAKVMGAHVTAVCSADNAELLRSFGADVVIDYAAQDFTKNGETYEVIMDNAGDSPYARCKDSLRAKGRLLLVAGDLPGILYSIWTNLFSDKSVVAGPASEKPELIYRLADMAAAGQYRSCIDRTLPLQQIAEAHAYVDGGHKKGSVVISIPQA